MRGAIHDGLSLLLEVWETGGARVSRFFFMGSLCALPQIPLEFTRPTFLLMGRRGSVAADPKKCSLDLRQIRARSLGAKIQAGKGVFECSTRFWW
jgi:hypothetical protein